MHYIAYNAKRQALNRNKLENRTQPNGRAQRRRKATPIIPPRSGDVRSSELLARRTSTSLHDGQVRKPEGLSVGES